ncbi:hypothetical protein M5X11_15985 [Paenibacillus alginolyticus]|uniref:hypothetical protein n=1 Tax=Paenibacillus alginolyticus TaxID=59839 RepID=UPI00040DB0BA|nr:hypothetical protein [Paenibacillus alginolyticus]MCY9666444.1 hypothetical protein [Paenibacillus alginolyticus]
MPMNRGGTSIIHIRALEAEIVEAIKSGHEIHHIRDQIQKKPRYFRNTITRMVELGILEKVEKGMYAVKVEKYTVRPDSEVIEERKRKTRSIINNNIPALGDRAISLIQENYPKMLRSSLLKLLHKAGYHLTKFELNLIIMNEGLASCTMDVDQGIA